MKTEQFVVKGSGACLLTETAAAAAYDAFLNRKLEIIRHQFTSIYIFEKEKVILASHDVCLILKNNFKHLKNKSTTDTELHVRYTQSLCSFPLRHGTFPTVSHQRRESTALRNIFLSKN